MPRGNVGETVGGMFDDLKSRLGFNGGKERYDDYDEYSNYDEYEEYGSDYADDEPVGGYRPLTSSSRQNRYASSDISSSLVSINDVKATTPLPDLESAGSHAQADTYGSSYGSTPAATTPVQGAFYNDNVAPTASASTSAAPAGAVSAAPAAGTAGAGAGSYDPYEAYSTSNPQAHTPTRTMTVVKPSVYGDVERVARAVKSGDVVVLAMRYTPDDLSKRILDFSFGVASALDANVECPGDKVFAIARGNALTPDEKRRLGAQGIL